MSYQKRNRWVTCDVCGGQERFNTMKKGIAATQKGWNVCPLCYDPAELSNRPEISNSIEGKTQEVK